MSRLISPCIRSFLIKPLVCGLQMVNLQILLKHQYNLWKNIIGLWIILSLPVNFFISFILLSMFLSYPSSSCSKGISTGVMYWITIEISNKSSNIIICESARTERMWYFSNYKRPGITFFPYSVIIVTSKSFFVLMLLSRRNKFN